MSRLGTVPNFRVEDYPGDSEWISNATKMFILLNGFVQGVNNILDSNVDFFSNIRSVSSNYTMTTFTQVSFQWPFFTQVQPRQVDVIQAVKGNAQTPTILFCAWSYNSATGSITISKVLEMSETGVGALDGSTYKFTIRATV